MLVQRASELNWDEIGTIRTLGLSAGASAPEVIVDEIITAFKERFSAEIELAITAEETENFLVNRELRNVPLTVEDMAWVNGERPLSASADENVQ
jgi:4-hydroxy-3-methylbut-2-en-1-yl diphosphate reductase